MIDKHQYDFKLENLRQKCDNAALKTLYIKAMKQEFNYMYMSESK